jgi:hypothetical protein
MMPKLDTQIHCSNLKMAMPHMKKPIFACGFFLKKNMHKIERVQQKIKLNFNGFFLHSKQAQS